MRTQGQARIRGPVLDLHLLRARHHDPAARRAGVNLAEHRGRGADRPLPAHASNAVVPLPEEAGVLPAASGGTHEALEEQGGLQAYMPYMHGDEAAVGCQTAGGCCRSASALDCGSPQKVHHTCSRTC